MMFDPEVEWDKLTPEQQRAIGIAALIWHVAIEAQALLDGDIADLRERRFFTEADRVMAIDRRWERAEQIGSERLRALIPMDADLYDEGPAPTVALIANDV